MEDAGQGGAQDEQGTHTAVGSRDVQGEFALIQLFRRMALDLKEATGIKGQAELDRISSLNPPSLPPLGASLVAQNLPAMQETRVRSLGREDSPGGGNESHGQRSLVGYSPWGCKELDTTEAPEYTHR